MRVRGAILGSLWLVAGCGAFETEEDFFYVPPAGKRPVLPRTQLSPAEQCALPLDPAACYAAELLSEPAAQQEFVDAIDGPPAEWRAPSRTIPFGYLTEAACVDVPAFRDPASACRVDQLTAHGELIEREHRSADGTYLQRTNAAGRVLFEQFRDAQGRPLREDTFDLLSGNRHTEIWTYREDGALVDHSVADSHGDPWVAVSTCDGRVHARVSSNCFRGPLYNVYDADGRLTQIRDERIVDGVPTPLFHRDFVYDGEGRLRLYGHGSPYWAPNSMTWLDSSGRPVRTRVTGDLYGMPSEAREDFEYGPHGLVRIYRKPGNGYSDGTGLTENRYDAQGRLVLSWSVEEYFSPGFRVPSNRAVATRITYACSGLKVREERDENQDGVADSEIRWSSGPDGSVNEETYFQGQLSGIRRYSFGCDED